MDFAHWWSHQLQAKLVLIGPARVAQRARIAMNDDGASRSGEIAALWHTVEVLQRQVAELREDKETHEGQRSSAPAQRMVHARGVRASGCGTAQGVHSSATDTSPGVAKHQLMGQNAAGATTLDARGNLRQAHPSSGSLDMGPQVLRPATASESYGSPRQHGKCHTVCFDQAIIKNMSSMLPVIWRRSRKGGDLGGKGKTRARVAQEDKPSPRSLCEQNVRMHVSGLCRLAGPVRRVEKV